MLSLSDYDYDLPEELIAQEPLKHRDQSKLLICRKEQNELTHTVFSSLPSLLDENDVIIFNDTKVINARIKTKRPSGAPLEFFLTESSFFLYPKPFSDTKPSSAPTSTTDPFLEFILIFRLLSWSQTT